MQANGINRLKKINKIISHLKILEWNSKQNPEAAERARKNRPLA